MSTLVQKVVRDQRVRFVVVGAINTGVGYAIYAALTLSVFANVPAGYFFSLVISYAAAICMAFVLYRRFVFVVTDNLLRDFARFVGVYAVSIALNAVLLPLAVEILGIQPLIAQLGVLVITTTVSFVGHRSFSFRRAL